MNALQLHLTKLIGKKEATIGCKFIMPSLHGEDEVRTIMRDGSFVGMLCEIIGHPATLSDLHRWFNINNIDWNQGFLYNQIIIGRNDDKWFIEYDSSKDLLEQSDTTLKQIIDLITSYQ